MLMKSKFAAFGIALALALSLVLFGCIRAEWANPSLANNATNLSGTGQIANPSATYCISKGYLYEITYSAAGEGGDCVFPNGNRCDGWAYYRGECDENGTVAAAAALEGEFCGGIAGLQCASGLACVLDGAYPDAGGVCMNLGKANASNGVFHACQLERLESCTEAAKPVCGRAGSYPSTYDSKDYYNPCVACSKSSPALGYYLGTCLAGNHTEKAKTPENLYDCPSVRYEVCTQEYDPVCGRIVDGSSSASYFSDFANPCVACSTASNAIAYYVGTCESRNP